MVLENQTSELVSRLREAAGNNLQSLVLYGSAATGEFTPEYSNLNLLCVLRDTSFPALSKIAPVIDWWAGKKHSAPSVLTAEEIRRSLDVFAIEFLDMKNQHRVLFGEDLLTSVEIPMDRHRVQLEYELREKLVLLRERLLVAKGDQLWDLMLHSLPSFTTLFRHVLIELGEPHSKSKRETLGVLAKKISLDVSAFLQLLDIREKKAKRKQFEVADVFTRYLAAIQQVIVAVDTM